MIEVINHLPDTDICTKIVIQNHTSCMYVMVCLPILLTQTSHGNLPQGCTRGSCFTQIRICKDSIGLWCFGSIYALWCSSRRSFNRGGMRTEACGHFLFVTWYKDCHTKMGQRSLNTMDPCNWHALNDLYENPSSVNPAGYGQNQSLSNHNKTDQCANNVIIIEMHCR